MSPSTRQDSPKVPEPWPTMELVRPEDADLMLPWVPSPGENDLSGFEVETFIPVSALLSDEVADAMIGAWPAKFIPHVVNPDEVDDVTEACKGAEIANRAAFRLTLQAAIQVVTGNE